jgi:DNA repair protein RadC
MKSDRTSSAPEARPADNAEHLHGLSDGELLGLLLGRGRAQNGSSRLAQQLVGEPDGLLALLGSSRAMLRHRGLSDCQALALLAACELACRLAHRRIPLRQPLFCLDHVARFLLLRYKQRDQEVLGAIFLDVRHRLLGEQEIFRGSLRRTTVESRDVLKECLLRGASGVVVFHTHPSGDPTPSDEDLRFTRLMATAAPLVGVDFLDHLVVGGTGCWVSLMQRGDW